ncbi:MAG: sensor histidine kinase [Gemmatimonadaceae bacterium]
MMSVGRRLTCALLPAIFGLFAAAGLAYYSEYSRQAPEWFVVVAIVSTLASLVIAWWNTRYVAHRVEELDAIEGTVDRLTTALLEVRAERNRLSTSLDEQRELYASLVASTGDEVVRQLEQVRLPLHILLENRFGELNENQEEMISAARSAAESADQVTLRLRDLANLDLGALPLRREVVRLGDLLATIVPGIIAETERQDVHVDVSIAPALPSFIGDRERLQEALTLVLREATERTTRGTTMRVTAEATKTQVSITVSGATGRPSTLARALPLRLVAAHGGVIEEVGERTTITLPIG